jgi:hypothetical protein
LKSSEKWKKEVEPIRIKKYQESLEKTLDSGKTVKQIRNEKIGNVNKEKNLERVNEGKHHYLNGFYAVLENGSTEWVSSDEYKKRKNIGCKHYAHPTSLEGKRRRETI